MAKRRKRIRKQLPASGLTRRQSRTTTTVPSDGTSANQPAEVVSHQPTNYAWMRRDLLRLLVVLTIVVVTLIGLLVSNEKTGWLNRAGDQLSHWFKLS